MQETIQKRRQGVNIELWALDEETIRLLLGFGLRLSGKDVLMAPAYSRQLRC